MKKVAKFEKVSIDQYRHDFIRLNPTADLKTIDEIYHCITLPKRATIGSAGYDFFLPFDVSLKSKASIIIPTGIRVKIDDGWVLKLYPRSGLGFKYRLQLDNTVGIIDSDYYGSSNEGHIKIKITCDAKNITEFTMNAGTGFAQGIFIEYGITYDDEVTMIRDGGFGSTSK